MPPAARLLDSTTHGGTIVFGAPTVLIGDRPAARKGDLHACPLSDGSVPHVGGVITQGAPTVLIENAQAARIGDECACRSVGTSGVGVPVCAGPTLGDSDGDGTRDSVTACGVTVSDSVDAVGPHEETLYAPGTSKVIGLRGSSGYVENTLTVSDDEGDSASLTSRVEGPHVEFSGDALAGSDDSGRTGIGASVSVGANAGAVSHTVDVHQGLVGDYSADAEASIRVSEGVGVTATAELYKCSQDGMLHLNLGLSPEAVLVVLHAIGGPDPTDALLLVIDVVTEIVPTVELSLALGISNKQNPPPTAVGTGSGGTPNHIATGEPTVIIGDSNGPSAMHTPDLETGNPGERSSSRRLLEAVRRNAIA